MTQLDTIIIGGGLAGLTAGLLLQKQGQNVAIYEKSTHIGGRAMTRQKKGYHLNLGPHALYRTGAGMSVLASLGIQPKGKTPTFGKTPLALTPNGTKPLPITPAAFMGKSLMSGKRWGLTRAFAKLFGSHTDKLEQVTWGDWLEANIPDLQVRDFIATLGRLTTYANAPHLASAGATIEQIKSGLLGNVLYLDGGWQQLVDGLKTAVHKADIPLQTQVAATHIIYQDECITVQFGNGQIATAKQVILAVPPKVATQLLPQSEALATTTASLQPIRAACLTVGLRHLPNPDVLTCLGVGTSFYGIVHSASGRIAPDDKALLHTAIYLAPDDRRKPAELRAFLENALDQMQSGWQGLCEVEDFFPYITVAHATVSAHQPRPAMIVPDVPNMYVIGDWVDSEGMLADGSFASARDVVKIITR